MWVVSELYYPEDSATGHFLTGIAEGLAETRNVGVLCSQPTYLSRGVRFPRFERRRGVDIHRCLGTAFDKDNIVLRVVNLVSISFAIFLAAMRRVRAGECVLVVTNPPLLPFVVMAACRIKRARCVLLIHDVYPEVLIATGLLPAQGILVRFADWLTTRLYRGASEIVVLGRDMRRLVVRKRGDGFPLPALIENWADHDDVRPSPRKNNAFLERIGLMDKFVIQYAGNMGRTHDLESLLDCAEKLKREASIHFLFIGAGSKKKWLEAEAGRRGLANLSVMNYAPRESLSESLNGCDLAVIPLISSMLGVSVPSRFYNVLAAGKPVLAIVDPESELANVVRDESVGWVVPPQRPDQILEAVLAARSNPTRLAEMGRRARSAAEGKYTRQRAVEAYRALFENLEEK